MSCAKTPTGIAVVGGSAFRTLNKNVMRKSGRFKASRRGGIHFPRDDVKKGDRKHYFKEAKKKSKTIPPRRSREDLNKTERVEIMNEGEEKD